jgi:predicted phosphodiesterase
VSLALDLWPSLASGTLAAWLLVGLVLEIGARRAERLGRRRPPPAFSAPPRTGADGASARIAFLGDLQRGVANVARPLARRLAQRPVDLLVSSGDLVAHGEAPYYGTLLSAWERHRIDTPTRAVPGNHDLFPRGVRDASLGGALFESRIGPRHWALRVGPVLVVGLDDATRAVTGPQMSWLLSTLREHAGVPWIAVCHRPPRNVQEPDARPETDLLGLVALFEERAPLLVVCGHLHERVEREVNGVRYVVNALGGDVHGTGLLRGPAELLEVAVGPGAPASCLHGFVPLRRAASLRVLLDQFCVRLWRERRTRAGRLVAAPATLLFALLGSRLPSRPPGRAWE